MRYRYGLGAALVACALPAAAQQTLDPVVVTANRTPQSASETLASVDVITREDIEQRQPLDVPDLLGDLAGIDLSRNGGRGNTASINIRGTSNDQALLLVDGVRVGSATTGGPALANLAPEQIERIEVVRGPRASLYGADAIGGVIQIFTRKNDGAQASVTAGGRDTKAVNAGYGRTGEDGYWSINAARHLTDGFDVVDDNGEPDDDGFRQTSFSFRGARELTDRARLTAAVQYREGEPRFDGSPDGSSNTQHSTRVGLALTPTKDWDLSLDVTRAFDDSDGREFGGGRFTTQRHAVNLQNNFYIGGDQVVTLGGQFRRDEVDGSTDYNEDERDNAAVFGQYQWRPGNWDFELSLRHDDNEAFGGATTGSIAAGYRLTDTVRGFVSYGTGFKAPSFNDLFFPGFGNPDLDPERSRSWEATVAGSGSIDWRFTAFRTEIDDLIGFDPATFTAENVDNAIIEGVETRLSTTLGGFRTRLNATLQNPENAQTGNTLRRRAEVLANLDISRQIGDLRLGAAARYRGDRYEDAANTDQIDGFATLDLRASWQLAPQWQLRGVVRNATNRDYTTARTSSFTAGDEFNAPGRQALITLSWNQGE
jgi:vitamin B12 transporter